MRTTFSDLEQRLLGTTNGLVSVDALQEFRIQTSSYSPEFGRTPGGQISLVTRAGTNVVHGNVSVYFRRQSSLGGCGMYVC
jgi:hypothetical protein